MLFQMRFRTLFTLFFFAMVFSSKVFFIRAAVRKDA